MSSKTKKRQVMDRQAEMEAARLFGKHVTRDKAILLAVVTTVACALPAVLGLRLWEQMPPIVPTGLILSDGRDDSLPRYMVVFGLPGLMCVLNGICHAQLWINQKRVTVPKTPVRLVGRWGFPVLSVLFCGGMMFQAADLPYSALFVTPCVLALALLMLGAHMWDCPKDARLALRFAFTQRGDSWQAVHRFAGWTWLAAGLAVLGWTMYTGTSGLATAAVIALALAAPFVYGTLRRPRLK